VLISNVEGQIIEANDAFSRWWDIAATILTSGRLRVDRADASEWQAASQRAAAQIRATGIADLFEKEYVRKDGSHVPVLVAAAAVGDTGEIVAFVLDLTERKRAEKEHERLRQAQNDLAYYEPGNHGRRAGASLAHEIKQPIAASVLNAKTCVRWLERDPPDVTEACEAASRTVRDATRAADIIDRVRSLYRRGPPNGSWFDLNEIIQGDESSAARYVESALYRDPCRARHQSAQSHGRSRASTAGIDEPHGQRHRSDERYGR